jgi:hypothetical protein
LGLGVFEEGGEGFEEVGCYGHPGGGVLELVLAEHELFGSGSLGAGTFLPKHRPAILIEPRSFLSKLVKVDTDWLGSNALIPMP